VENSLKFLDPRTLAKLQGLELRARRIVEGYVAGLHRSPFQGYSIEFAEHRQYAPGDDLRYVDWKVFGRTDKIYLKQFEEETNLLCYLVLDISRSMQYRGPDVPLSKLEYAQCTAAALARLILLQQDSVGLVTFDRELRTNLRPSSKPQHYKQLLQVLTEVSPREKTATGPIFHDLAERFTKRGLVLVLSDLFDDVEPLLAGLKHFRHRRHDVILLHVLDPTELDFPFQETTLFRGLELEPDLKADPRGVRAAYLEEFQKYLQQVRKGCRLHQLDYLLLRTDQDLGLALARFLAARNARLKS